MVQDIAPGSANSTPADFVIAGQHLFFSAEDNTTGRELWALPLQALSAPAQPEIASSAGTVGASGSCFPLTISGFAPQSRVLIAVDDVPVGQATTDAAGGYRFTLFFTSAMPPGTYTVSVSETPSRQTMAIQPRVARIEITIDLAAQVLPNPNDAPLINSRPTLYLPTVVR